ncbi:MAG: rhamnulokinase [Chthonomonadales bacterium]
MPGTARFLTFDLGAESGRAVLGTIARSRLTLTEVHRFPNEPQRILGRFYWDTVRLFAEISNGLARTVREHPGELQGMGVDTWGVDYALLDRDDELLGVPYHYRDSRTDGVMDEVFRVVPRREIYQTTGIQFMQLNTLFQLMALRLRNSPLLEQARALLLMPDLFNFWLTGVKVNEFTIATTTQFYDPVRGDWARGLLERLGLPTQMLGKVVPPGTVLGPLHAGVQRVTGAGAVPVIAPATHDTGSAVAAVPAEGRAGWAYVSCGTWSLVGVEVDHPVINDRTLEFNLTNEGGVNGTVRLLRNVMGLWLLQECRRSWERQGRSYSYEELARLGAEAPGWKVLLDPDDGAFLNPQDMPQAIAEFCTRTGQVPPDGVAQMVRCILESLAMKYRWVVERLEAVTHTPIQTIHIIGGGSRNALLCQLTADVTGRRVLAGPVEATAIGNLCVQAIAAGELDTLEHARDLIRSSFPLAEYRPSATHSLEEHYRRFEALVQG